MVVDEDHRGRGHGRRLMAATLELAWEAGCYKAMLPTGSKNPGTHAFYRACGLDPESKTAYHTRRPGWSGVAQRGGGG